VRVWHLLKQMNCNLAAFLVAYALEHGLAPRLIPRERPLIVLAPSDAGLRERWECEMGSLLCPAGHRRLVELLRRHLVTGESALRLEKDEGRKLQTLQVRSGPHEAQGYRGYVVDRLLHESLDAEVADAR